MKRTITCKCQSDSIVVLMGSFTIATSNKEVGVSEALKLKYLYKQKKKLLRNKEGMIKLQRKMV